MGDKGRPTLLRDLKGPDTLRPLGAYPVSRTLQQFCDCGNAWDKRVAWETWGAWTRILHQSAIRGGWLDPLDKLNMLGPLPSDSAAPEGGSRQGPEAGVREK